MSFIRFFDSFPNSFDDEIMDCLVCVGAELTNKDKVELLNIVDKIQEELDEWNFNEVVDMACARYFNPLNIEYNFVVVDMEIDI